MFKKIDFVNILDIEKSIIVDMKYSYEDNFVGTTINGYKKNIAYIKTKVALKLKDIQTELKKHGLSIIIYDAYRPQKASEHFFTWSQNALDQKYKNKYYPNFDKKLSFDMGYLARKSSHTKGIAVDISIVNLSQNEVLDMGGCFDFFDPISRTINDQISPEHLENRLFLKSIMERNGFENLPSEWWHYSIKDNIEYREFYDFDVE